MDSASLRTHLYECSNYTLHLLALLLVVCLLLAGYNYYTSLSHLHRTPLLPLIWVWRTLSHSQQISLNKIITLTFLWVEQIYYAFDWKSLSLHIATGALYGGGVKQWWIQTAITGFSVTKSVKMVVWNHCLPLRNHHWWPEVTTVFTVWLCMDDAEWGCFVR